MICIDSLERINASHLPVPLWFRTIRASPRIIDLRVQSALQNVKQNISSSFTNGELSIFCLSMTYKLWVKQRCNQKVITSYSLSATCEKRVESGKKVNTFLLLLYEASKNILATTQVFEKKILKAMTQSGALKATALLCQTSFSLKNKTFSKKFFVFLLPPPLRKSIL